MTDRLSDADLKLLRRLETRLQSYQAKAQAEQEIIFAHLGAEYNLQQGDNIEDDGSITRAAMVSPGDAPCQLLPEPDSSLTE